MLTRRFLLYLLLPVLVLLLASQVTVYLVTKMHLKEQIDANLGAEVDAIDAAITARIEAIRGDLTVMQAYRERNQYHQYKAFGNDDKAHQELLLLEQNLVSVADLKPRCKAFHFFDRSGRSLIGVVGGERTYDVRDVSGEAWFARTLELAPGASLTTDVYAREPGDVPMITISAPSRFQGVVVGVFAIDVWVSDLTSDLIQAHEPRVGYAYVIGPSGRILARTQSAPSVQDVSSLASTRRIFAGSTGEASIDAADGDRVREAFRPQTLTNLGIVVGIPHSEAFAPIDRMRRRVIPISIAGFLLIAGVGLVMVRRTIKPIRQLTEVAGEITAGDLDRTIDVRTGDEVQELAQNFNRMTASLRESNQTLRSALEQAHESADVAERRASELAHAYEELQSTQAQLVQAEKMSALGQLAGGVAHDFNNLLSGIMSCADLMKRLQLSPEEKKTYLDIILDSSQRAADLVKQLLAFSRAGPAQSVRVELGVIVREVSGILRRTIDPCISIEEQLEADTAVITGDPTQLQSALLNLGINARDAMPKGGTLTLSTRTHVLDEAYCAALPEPIEPGPYVEVGVADTGEGMTRDVVARIFEPFFTTKDVGAGTGLGLSAVYGTLRAHGGTINVYSEPGEGTIFRIYLPVSSAGGTAWVKPAPGAVVRGTGRILLVDDEPVIRTLGADMLKWLGYEVVLAEDGVDALDCFREQGRIDLVIADLAMPRMNGRDLLRRLRDLDPDVRVLIASGFLPNVRDQELRAEGAVDVLPKPYVVSELSRRVASALAADVPAPPLHVMVVDDTQVNRKTVGALLQTMGHTVVRVGDAEQALTRLAEESFDVLLLDLGLPGMDGIEATTVIRKREAASADHLPIVAMTGETTRKARDRCSAAGMDDFLAKPIDLKALRAVLARVRVAPHQDGVDWSRTRSAIGNQEVLLREMATAFLEETPALMDSLRDAVERGAAEPVLRLAHALRGSMLYFKGHSAARHVEALETQAREGEMAAAAKMAVLVEGAYRSLCEDITRFLDKEAVPGVPES